MKMKNIFFAPVPFGRVADHIEKTIKEKILNGIFEAGDKLPTEKELASQFGVSIVSLREALRSLQVIGLIEKKKGHGGGIFVSQINEESIKTSLSNFLNFKDLTIQHIYESRMILEPTCARLAIERITPDELIKLGENVSWCEEILNRPSQEFSEQVFFNIDDRAIEFHRIIVNSTRNPIVNLTFDYVIDFLRACELQLLVPDKNHSMWVIRDHRNILDFLKNGDGKRCEEEMYLHLKKIEEYDIRLKEFRKEHPEKKSSNSAA
jgi:GntR family transcriptional regulator, transcriptional repressor for pyruvate dehydrogenase complex